MDDQDRLAERFEAHRDHLRGVAYRMLGSRAEADDAVQEAWFRLARHDAEAIDNLGGWLTTVVGRICLDGLRSRRARAEDAAGPAPHDDAHHAPDDGPGPGPAPAPEDEALLADEVGLALLVVLDALGPAERVAFVLHDLFAVPFDRIAPIVDRSPVATKKLASRARQRVRGTPAVPAADLAGHRRVVDAFLRAARGGDLRGLVAVLDPDVVRRADDALVATGIAPVLRGAAAVAEETAGNAPRAVFARAMLVDGRVGIVVAPAGRLRLVMALTLTDNRITGINVTSNPTHLSHLELALLDP